MLPRLLALLRLRAVLLWWNMQTIRIPVPLDVDIWMDQLMVVSKEPLANQVREIIARRENWLSQQWIPRNTLMPLALLSLELSACSCCLQQ